MQQTAGLRMFWKPGKAARDCSRKILAFRQARKRTQGKLGKKINADGLSNRNVAQKLGLTEPTVSNYLFRIYEKLWISSRVELILYALKQKQDYAVTSPRSSVVHRFR